ncbi:family 20 glycosylhydrolase [Nocardia sp. NPDC056611]|uniref:family 20 glycosylhydrolase n=1 Tax=Nocardia sp. NPDC056611 TaxID=3345877 RepID=UPI00366FBBC0
MTGNVKRRSAIAAMLTAGLVTATPAAAQPAPVAAIEYPWRQLMVDTGREYFPIDWLEARVRELSALGMNTLHLHLSDNQGFRLRNDTHPEVNSAQTYSKDEIRALVSYAEGYGITVVPEIDMPSHMGQILAHHPELQLVPAHTTPAEAQQDSLLGGPETKIDLSNPAAYQLMGDLLREFLPLFPGPYWHLGADEYVSDFDRYPQLSPYAVRDYITWASSILAETGKTPIVWNDGLQWPGALGLDPSIIIDYWSAGTAPWIRTSRGPAELAANGNRLVNAGFTPTYFVTGGPASGLNTPPALLKLWNPGIFVDLSTLPAASRSQLIGSGVFVWCDDPTAMTPDEISGPLSERLVIMADKLRGR